LTRISRAEIAPDLRIATQQEAARLFEITAFITNLESVGVQLDSTNAGYFRYMTPRYDFKAHARSLGSRTHDWKIGFVQVLMKSEIVHHYETGQNAWSFPRLPVSDSSGSEYPWYGGRNGYALGWGTANLAMSDHFDVHVSWFLTRRDGSLDASSRLTSIHREQTFRVWIMALDEAGKIIYPLNEFEYTVHVDIAVDPTTRGARTLDYHIVPAPHASVGYIDPAWLGAPTANGSQQFVRWSPR
jgi:hypothetical protein